ncbi:anthocyanidin 5,3-O-glucosyltransferase-like [Phragmites australis]|uniref:anthocyanidin 5,3-O-glucosyltransferase-like n=1 Tax=Phragmites australis TaxID=29695 RepID=UPI002D79104A|nr:anthocyanidin 5,3-O-glucosyltransferase-like [Phragmites australis]
MVDKTVVLYPSLGVGHLNPMVQLAKAFLRRGGVAVTIAVVDPPDKDAVLETTLARLAAASPSITVRFLPIPPCDRKEYSHPLIPILDALRVANPALRDFLGSLTAVDALVVDMFCTEALDVAAELAIPAYIFYPSAAGDFAVYLQIPDFCREAPCSLKDMGKAPLNFAGVPPVRALDMPDTMQDRETDVGRVRLQQLARMPEATGILVNSFDWLEARALKALREGHCLPGRSTPKIYCVGPLVDGGSTDENGERHACLEWLDGQPKRSVVFLCFGSMGTFSAAQLKEMARGLEGSGHRFLWSVRSPREGHSNSLEPDLEALLPDGFLKRTKDRGLVVKNWAPQTEVLRHEAVGAFVTHCGWNSALEAIMAGVPMICWPLYAEQRLNKVHMVEEMKVGVAVEGYDEVLVKADEVDAKVRLVMESEEGKMLRERMAIAKEMAADAVKEGGSSDVELTEFLRHLGNINLKNEE